MPRLCETCGKKTTFGSSIARRGIAKYKGGVGLNITGVSKRRYHPNLQKVRAEVANGAIKRIKVCAKCLRAGKVKKPLRRVIPEGLRNRMLAKEEAKSPAARRKLKAQAGVRRRARKAKAAARVAAKSK